MANVLDFQANSGFGNVTAGAALAYLDAVELDAQGNGYKVQVTDYAAVSPVGQIVAETTVDSGGLLTQLTARNPIAQRAANGDIFCAAPNATSANGLTIYRYSAAGSLLGSVAVDTSANTINDTQIGFLSNGNIVVSYVPTATGQINFAIYTPLLGQVVAPTIVESPLSTQNFNMLVLSGGGFALCYLKSGPAIRLAIYSNTGGVTLAATTIFTPSGTASTITVQMANLSNGNIAIVFCSCYSTALGTYFGIYTAAGASVVAFANVDGTTAVSPGSVPGQPAPAISVLTGFFAFCTSRAANNKVWVYSNAGVLQGGAFTHATTAQGQFSYVLLNDGTQFYLLDTVNGSNFIVLSVIPTTGTNFASYSLLAVAGVTGAIAAVVDRGNRILVMYVQSGATAWSIGVINTTGPYVEKTMATFGTAPTTNSVAGNILAGGDFSFIAGYTWTSAASSLFYIGKAIATAVIGQVQAAAAAGAAAPVKATANMYPVNAMIGSPSKAFDHSSATPHGNKGTLMANALSVSGL